jgi:hypothetical protein
MQQRGYHETFCPDPPVDLHREKDYSILEKERRMLSFKSRFDFAYGSWREFITALFPFILLGAVLPIMNFLGRLKVITNPGLLSNFLAVCLLGLFAILFLLGLGKGLPRWFLPYLGFAFSIFSVYGFSGWLERTVSIPYSRLYDSSWILGQVAYQGSLWIGLFVVALLIVALIGIVPAFHRFRKDWTLPGFLLYGAAPFALVATFDDYVNEETWELLAFLILAGGMWLYLHIPDHRKRYLALFGGLTGSLFLAAVAKAILFSSPDWPWPTGSFSWQNELMSTVIMWFWIALAMCVPLVFQWIRQQVNPQSAV